MNSDSETTPRNEVFEMETDENKTDDTSNTTKQSSSSSSTNISNEMNNVSLNKLSTLIFEVQFIRDFTDEATSKETAKADLNDLSLLKARYDNIVTVGQGQTIDFNERKEFLSAYRDAREKLLRIVGIDNTLPSPSCGHPQEDRIFKLPALDVPKFSGSIEKWAAFKADFLRLISDARIKDSERAKQRYLTMALQDDAEKLIQNLKEGSFEECWSIVCQTYDQPFRRVHAHLEALFKKGNQSQPLRTLLVDHRQHASGLRSALDELEISVYDMVVIASFLDKTSPATRLSWEKEVGNKGSGHCTLKNFYEFMEKECGALERAGKGQRSCSAPLHQKAGSSTSIKRGIAAAAASKSKTKKKKTPLCAMCGEGHYLNKCQKFLDMKKEERIEFVAGNSVCRICLCKGCKGVETAKNCSFKFLMCPCGGLHNGMLHQRSKESRGNNTGESLDLLINTNLDVDSFNPEMSSELSTISLGLVNPVVANSLKMHIESEALLTTALVKVRVNDKVLEARAFLDNGSQVHFATTELIKILNAKVVETKCQIDGILGSAGSIAKEAILVIESCYTNFKTSIPVLVVNNILNSHIPTDYFEINSWQIPSWVQLADPQFNTPAGINLLLGLQVFWKILGSKKLCLRPLLPELRESELGWLVAGDLQVTARAENTFVYCAKENDHQLLRTIEKFWIVESLETLNPPLSNEEKECERIFTETTFRRADGRFVVTLPFKQSPTVLGESRTQALNRFYALEKRLANNSALRKDYVSCMEEYIQLDHMKEIKETSDECIPSYYIPHHAVIKPSSTSSPVRVVFNASMPTTSGLSLNDILMAGPVVQPSLFSTMLRFRTHKYCFVADVKKMYRMVRLNQSCTPLQRIFWRKSPEEELKVYELQTVTFGTKTAPYLATRCFKELALNYSESYPAAKSVLLNDFYVDDVLSGADDIDTAKTIINELRKLLGLAGFELTKWCSNEPEILADIEEEIIKGQGPLIIGESETIKTLGTLWLPNKDAFVFRFAKETNAMARTKREILSASAGFYDVLGLCGPVIVTAKLFMQFLWTLRHASTDHNSSVGKDLIQETRETDQKSQIYCWNDELPEEALTKWREFAQGLYLLDNFEIPRFISFTKTNLCSELHGFADASSRAYGAVIYSRVIDSFGDVKVNLLCSKSRIAPLKQLSIARLELLAAELLAKLIHKVKIDLSLNIKIDKVRLWSDSKVALSWIGSESIKWNVFVAHRVSNIQSLTVSCIWDYVQSATNPADILSRGALPLEFVQATLWHSGSDWLSNQTNPWSDSIEYLPNNKEPLERRAIKVVFPVQSLEDNLELFSLVGEPMTGKFSTEFGIRQGLVRLVRLVALLLRFLLNCSSVQKHFPKSTGILKPYKFCNAITCLVKIAQKENFAPEIKELMSVRNSTSTNKIENKGRPLYKSKLANLNAFLDNQGILRVGGRLENAELSYNERHPIILHSHHKLAKLIVWHEHLAHLHAGPRLLKSVVRRRYWILGLSNLVKKCLLKCHTCITLKAKTQEQIMVNLPKQRLVLFKVAFNVTGVDYAGPFSIIGKGGRHKVFVKAYVAVFVCFTTKAVHLELVSDLTSQAFLAVLTRFISRRGIPVEIHSDNGTTFVGANTELQKLYSFLDDNAETINNFAVEKGISWHFIPASTPHFRGIWESAVKSMKAHLKSVLLNRTFTFEEYTTLLTQIEACLNSRPLTPQSSDPDDLGVLTPGHFLVGGPLTALLNESLTDIPENRVKLYKRREQVVQFFWKRWSSEYLNTLQQRNKWRAVKDELKVNDLVLIKEDNVPPATWKRGRIQTLHPGSDGLSRVVTLKTGTGSLQRPIVKLVYLPTE